MHHLSGNTGWHIKKRWAVGAFFSLVVILLTVGCATTKGKPDRDTCRRETWKSEKLGKALFQKDVVAAWATDVLRELVFPRDKRVRGWITVKTESEFRVSFIGSIDDKTVEFYTVHFPGFSLANPVIVRHDEPREVQGDVLAMFKAKTTAGNAPGLKFCDKGFNSDVLSANLIGEPGWLVYLLTPHLKADEIVFGRHYRIHVSQDGSEILKVQPLTKSCMRLTPSCKSRDERVAAFVTHLVTKCPLEIHVFLSLLHGLPIGVKTKSGFWFVDGDDIGVGNKKTRRRRPRIKKRWIQVQLAHPPLAIFEPHQFTILKLSMDIPSAREHDGFFPSIEYRRNIFPWLTAGASFGIGSSAGKGQMTSNPAIHVAAGKCSYSPTKHRREWNGCIIGELSLGLGLFEMSSQMKSASYQGFLSDLRWSRFKPESMVFEPVLILAAHGNGFGIQGQIGPSFGVPVFQTDRRDTEAGLVYGFSTSLSMNVFELGFGIRGFKELPKDGDHRYAVDIGLRSYFESPRLFPWIRATIPVNPGESDLNAVVSLGITWEYDK